MASSHRTVIPDSRRKAKSTPLFPVPGLALASFLSAIAAAGFLASRALFKNRRSALIKPEGRNINKESSPDHIVPTSFSSYQFVHIADEGSQLAQIQGMAVHSLEELGKASSDPFLENNDHDHDLDHVRELNSQQIWDTQETRKGLDHGEEEGKGNSARNLLDDGFSQSSNCNAANRSLEVNTGDQEEAVIFVLPPEHENGTNGHIPCNAKGKRQCNLDSGKGLYSGVDADDALSANVPHTENDQSEEHDSPENASASAEFNFTPAHKQTQSVMENQDATKAAFSNLTASSQDIDACFIKASECPSWIECIDYQKLGSTTRANGASQLALPASLLANESQQSITGKENLYEQKPSLLGTCINPESDNPLDSEEEMSNMSADDVRSESSTQELTSAAVNPLDLSPIEEARCWLDVIKPVDNLSNVTGLTKMPERKNQESPMHGCNVDCKVPNQDIEADEASGCEPGYTTARKKESAAEPPEGTSPSLSISRSRDLELNRGENLQIGEPQNGSGRESGIVAVSSISCEKSNRKLISRSLCDKNSDTDFKFDDLHVNNMQPSGHASARCENTKNQVLNYQPVNEIEVDVEKPEIVCAQNRLHSSFHSSIQRQQYESKKHELVLMSYSKLKTCENAGANSVGPSDRTDQSFEPEFRGAAIITHAESIPYLTTEVLIVCVLIGLVSLVFYSVS